MRSLARAHHSVRPLTNTILSNRQYDIEFQGYLSNHAKHGIIALERLGAAETRIQEWWDQYTTQTPYELTLEPIEWENVEACSKEEWYEWKGQKKNWQSQCLFLQNKLESGDMDIPKLVQTFAPDLLPGIAGALTHGIIHLGWALDADQHEWMTVEGLAYLNYCNLGVDPAQLLPSTNLKESSLLQSFERVSSVWQNENLAVSWVQAAKAKYDESFHSELVVAGFQWQLAKVLKEAHSVATSIPEWLSDTSTLSVDELFEQFYKTVVAIYLVTRSTDGHGDFLILHAITSLWALEHVCRVIADDGVTRKALQYYYSTLICLLAASSGGIPKYESVKELLQQVPFHAVDPDDKDWTLVTRAAHAEEEEHNIKLVYVCKELWKRYSHWTGFSMAAGSFTLTPNVGPSTTAFKA